MNDKQKLDEVYNFMQALKSSTTIPHDVDGAFRTRLSNSLGELSVSAKGVDTEDVAVNEAGAGSYAVMNDPDGFLQVTISGTIYYIPYFS